MQSKRPARSFKAPLIQLRLSARSVPEARSNAQVVAGGAPGAGVRQKYDATARRRVAAQ